MKVSIDEPRPGTDPRFHHDDRSAGTNSVGGLDEKPADVRYVMKHIGHHDRPQTAGRKRQPASVEDDVHVGTVEHFRRDHVRDVLSKKAGAGSQLEDPAPTLRHVTGNIGVPLLVELAQERFGCLLCVTFEQARAFELLQQPDSAIAAYERIVNLPSMDNEQRHLTYPAALRRLGELYDNKGDRKKALEYDGRLVDLWKDADPQLQGVIRDVRRRMAELAGEPPRR